jgi:zinc transporter ZupT
MTDDSKKNEVEAVGEKRIDPSVPFTPVIPTNSSTAAALLWQQVVIVALFIGAGVACAIMGKDQYAMPLFTAAAAIVVPGIRASQIKGGMGALIPLGVMLGTMAAYGAMK